MNKKLTFGLTAIAAVILSGCANSVLVKNEKDARFNQDLVNQRQEAAKAAVQDAEFRRVASQVVNRPYVAGNSIPLSRDARMPEKLRASVPITALFANKPVDLTVALQQLSQATGMSITATSDALMPAAAFGPKTGATASPVAAPNMVILKASNTPIWTILDDLASQAQASWRPTPSGAEFFRVETRTYEILTTSQSATTNSSLGRTGGAANAFNSDSKTSFEIAKTNQIDGLKISLESFMTQAGKFTLSPETQTLVVTDTPAALDKVEEFVKRQNKALSRRVRLLVEAIEVVSKEGSDFGLDWNIVYNTATGALTGAAPGGLASGQAGTFNFQQMVGPLSGSSLAIKALNEVGTVVNRRVFPLITTSGRPVTQALRTTFNYVDQVQATSIASSTTQVTQAPTVSQKDETVGTLLTLVPTAKGDGSVFLSVSYDVSTAEPLRPYTVGTGGSAVTVQQKTINGSGVIQELPMRSGRTEVIGGIELMTTQDTSRRLGDGVPLIAGGANSNNRTKTVTVLLATAVIEEGI